MLIDRHEDAKHNRVNGKSGFTVKYINVNQQS
jgi:hypothetical protein